MIVASTPRLFIRSENACQFFCGIESVIRSCDSEIQISHGSSPGYFSGTFSSWTSQPPDSLAIFANSSADHYDQITCLSFFCMGKFAFYFSWNQPNGSDKYAWFASETFIKVYKSLWCGNT